MDNKRNVGFSHVVIATNTAGKRFDCNQLTFVNKGNVACQIEGVYPLLPGESVTYTCWPGEINHGTYSFIFPAAPAAGTVQLVLVIVKTDLH